MFKRAYLFFGLSLVVSLFAGCCISSADAASAVRAPAASSLESGDFLWPKLDNKIVPYDSEIGEAAEAVRIKWEGERKAELSRLEGLNLLNAEERDRYAVLSNMNYQEFLSTYLGGAPVGTVIPLGAIGPVATGHVAIVDVRDGTPWIIEAMLHEGVREIEYQKWLDGRPGELVWHGRLKDVTAEKRAQIAVMARQQLNVPYDFWNFDLLDNKGFYCSKLAWFSVWKVTGLALDDAPKAKRSLWYSPKQMLKSAHISILFDPGTY